MKLNLYKSKIMFKIPNGMSIVPLSFGNFFVKKNNEDELKPYSFGLLFINAENAESSKFFILSKNNDPLQKTEHQYFDVNNSVYELVQNFGFYQSVLSQEKPKFGNIITNEGHFLTTSALISQDGKDIIYLNSYITTIDVIDEAFWSKKKKEESISDDEFNIIYLPLTDKVKEVEIEVEGEEELPVVFFETIENLGFDKMSGEDKLSEDDSVDEYRNQDIAITVDFESKELRIVNIVESNDFACPFNDYKNAIEWIRKEMKVSISFEDIDEQDFIKSLYKKSKEEEFEFDYDNQAGIYYIHDKRLNDFFKDEVSCAATPFWEDATGIVFSIYGESVDDEFAHIDIPFKLTGNIDSDADNYLSIIRNKISEVLSGKGDSVVSTIFETLNSTNINGKVFMFAKVEESPTLYWNEGTSNIMFSLDNENNYITAVHVVDGDVKKKEHYSVPVSSDELLADITSFIEEIKEVKNVNDINFNAKEKSLIAGMINRYGTGEHPIAENETIGFFTLSYVRDVTEKAIGSAKLSEDGVIIASDILSKINKA